MTKKGIGVRLTREREEEKKIKTFLFKNMQMSPNQFPN